MEKKIENYGNRGLQRFIGLGFRVLGFEGFGVQG